jgi:hypothetical protein
MIPTPSKDEEDDEAFLRLARLSGRRAPTTHVRSMAWWLPMVPVAQRHPSRALPELEEEGPDALKGGFVY